PFTALSYVWGTYSPVPDVIVCNDVQFKVTSNLHSALQHLRRSLGKFTIWVDAICIKQENSEEKQKQIPLMSEIYSRAEYVYIWLGEGTARTDRAM
ncbi:heterokaryon incompatibility, partial [Lophiostoma macrostomum CBS 122681]